MAASSYDEALRRMLVHEGGYTNDARDPGGPTNFGITIHDYRAYVKPNATAADVRAMKLGDAKAIYRTKYWNAMRCDQLPAGVDYAVFDYGVNSGIGRAGKVLRRLIGLPVAASAITDDVIRAVGNRDAAALVDAICDERLRFLQGLRTWPVFGKGWSSRVREVRTAALAMIGQRGTQSPTSRPSTGASPSTSAPGKGAVPVNTHAQTSSAGGVLAAGGAIASQMSDTASIVVLIAATIAIAIGAWFFWHWWQRRRQDAPPRT